jgi:hypothetical protein
MLRVPLTDSKPVTDGKLEEPCWKQPELLAVSKPLDSEVSQIAVNVSVSPSLIRVPTASSLALNAASPSAVFVYASTD